MPHRMPEFVSVDGAYDPQHILRQARQPENRVDAKDTNPKDAIGSTKLDMGLVPDSAIAHLALAFTEGALKYGRYNWRAAGVRSSIYHAAARRHLAKYWNGEWSDPKTKVPHLASVMACCAIILDAEHLNKLTDDRPPPARHLGELIDSMSAHVAHLKREFADHEPHQYTIADEV